MKQLPLNIVVTFGLLGVVFFAAGQGMPRANASSADVPAIVVEGTADGQLHLQGFGFRPGSLVNLQLHYRDRITALPIATTDAWVGANGSFSAELQLGSYDPSLGAPPNERPNDTDRLVVLASASNAFIYVPLNRAGARLP